MARTVAIIQQRTYSLAIDEEAVDKVTLDGQDHLIDWKQIAPLAREAKSHGSVGGLSSLLIAGKSYEVFARPSTRPEEKNGQIYEIFINSQRFEVAIEDERTRTLAGLVKGSAHSGGATIYAPMPGLVIGIVLEEGAEVKAGQPVIVLEAMKMENDLSSPINGKVKKILVDKGQTVDLGAPLVVIDANVETALPTPR